MKNAREDNEERGWVENASASAPREWRSRGYIPHRDKVGLVQSITFRLADSLPQAKLDQLKVELLHLVDTAREIARRKRIESWLDSFGTKGICTAYQNPVKAGLCATPQAWNRSSANRAHKS